MVQRFSASTLGSNKTNLVALLDNRLKSMGCDINTYILNGIVDNLDLSKEYRIIEVNNKKYLSTIFNNGYSCNVDEKSDYITRSVCYTLYGSCTPGYKKNSNITQKCVISGDLIIGTKSESDLGWSLDGFVYSDRYYLILYKEDEKDEDL